MRAYEVVWADVHTVIVKANNKQDAIDKAKQGQGYEELEELLPVEASEL